jgi:hypothetical protein
MNAAKNKSDDEESKTRRVKNGKKHTTAGIRQWSPT